MRVKKRARPGPSAQPRPAQTTHNRSDGQHTVNGNGTTRGLKRTGECPACGNAVALDVTPKPRGGWWVGCYSCAAEGVEGGDFLRALAEAVDAPGGGDVLADPLRWLAPYLDSAVNTGYVEPLPSFEQHAGWYSDLANEPLPRNYLEKVRGLDEEVIWNAGIGWDAARSAFTIPIYDAAGDVVNLVRRPWPHSEGSKYKVLAGRGIPERVQVYPLPLLDGPVLAVGGLLDALLGRQHGINAVSGTHGIGTALEVWLPHVRGRLVAVMWDVGEEKAMTQRVAAFTAAGVEAWPVRLSELGLPRGGDLTDALSGGYTAQDIRNLINAEYRRAA